MKNHLLGAEFFHEDRRTDRQTDRRDEANASLFRNFSNAPKNDFDEGQVYGCTNTIYCYTFKRYFVRFYSFFFHNILFTHTYSAL